MALLLGKGMAAQAALPAPAVGKYTGTNSSFDIYLRHLRRRLCRKNHPYSGIRMSNALSGRSPSSAPGVKRRS